MKISKFVTLLLVLLTSISAIAEETIVMLRHGEKPSLGLGQLSCMGMNRSLALPGILFTRFGHPSAIYAPNPGFLKKDHGINYNYIRPLATIEPTAIAAGLPVNTEWGFNDITHLNIDLLNVKNKDGVIFVAWEHKMIERIAKSLVVTLGGDPADIPKWSENDYDSLYVITIGNWMNGKREVIFHTESQGLNEISTDCGVNEENLEINSDRHVSDRQII